MFRSYSLFLFLFVMAPIWFFYANFIIQTISNSRVETLLLKENLIPAGEERRLRCKSEQSKLLIHLKSPGHNVNMEDITETNLLKKFCCKEEKEI